mgnify:CR=1 FL=1|tara:strand:- start:663 stop:788 length:126 start_codon:yes stop_codon:yes gene_type:complete
MKRPLIGYSKEQQEKINELLNLDKLSLALYIIALERKEINN